jgi:hypothetical protein
MKSLEEIFSFYNIKIFEGNQQRHVIDVIEDMFLKINSTEYADLMKRVSLTESREGHIFDQARKRAYK